MATTMAIVDSCDYWKTYSICPLSKRLSKSFPYCGACKLSVPRVFFQPKQASGCLTPVKEERIE